MFSFLIGTRGNLAQERLTLLFSLLVCIPSLFGYLYFLLWQTYVLRFEVVLVSLSFLGITLHLLLGLLALWNFQRQAINNG
jgi:transmembrane protein 216